MQLTIPIHVLGLRYRDYMCSLQTTFDVDLKHWSGAVEIDAKADSITFTFSNLRVPSVDCTLKFDVFCKT